ncbi:transposase family protein, partial [Haliscomenobacter sp.]|uniref:transposase family protein n=1 Tax=Haliscomenobacter sp. TaxID=2717303 RepID=UPI00336529E2
MSRSNPSDQIKSLLARFEGITDMRIERKKLYPLKEILFLSISAVVSGYSEWDEIVDFGEEKQE